MYIWKPLTKSEEKLNKKFPEKEQIKPHTAFYIDEKKYPKEALLWKALGFEGVKDAYCELTKKEKKKSE